MSFATGPRSRQMGSDSAQAVELDLSQFAGMVPHEMFGGAAFPRIGELPYLLTPAARGILWFQLKGDA